MTARVVRTHHRFPSAQLTRIARTLLDAAPLCALATVSPHGRAHINTMYFARADPWDIAWISALDSQHSRNIRSNASAAVAVFDSNQRWGGKDRGIQVFGRAIELHDAAARVALSAYGKRFKHDERILSRYVAYRLRPTRMKLFDERAFGSGTFVTARVMRGGGLVWTRTEEYRDAPQRSRG